MLHSDERERERERGDRKKKCRGVTEGSVMLHSDEREGTEKKYHGSRFGNATLRQEREREAGQEI